MTLEFFGEEFSLRRSVSLLVLLAIAVGLLAYQVLFLVDKQGPDFRQDYQLAQLLASGEPLYRTSFETYRNLSDAERNLAQQKIGTAHPPSTGLFFLPYLALSLHEAFVLHSVVCLVMIGVAVFFVARALEYSPETSAALVVFAYVFGPTIDGIRFGQVAPMLSSFVLLSWLALNSGRSFLSGVLLGLASGLKLYPLLGLFYFIFARNLSAICGVFLTSLSLVLVSSSLTSFDDWLMYSEVVAPRNVEEWTAFPPGVSLVSWLATAFLPNRWSDPIVSFPELVRLASPVLIFLSLPLVFFLSRLPSRELSFPFFGVFLLMCLLAPVSHPHGLLIAWPALLWLGKRGTKDVFFVLFIFILFFSPQVFWWQLTEQLSTAIGIVERSPVRSYLVKIHAVGLLVLTVWFLATCSKESQQEEHP